jgi:hypothetical protein
MKRDVSLNNGCGAWKGDGACVVVGIGIWTIGGGAGGGVGGAIEGQTCPWSGLSFFRLL